MKKVTQPKEIFNEIVEAKRQGQVVGVVPTMGALHDGHLSLVQAAREKCDFVVATIFVNPTQFAPDEDLDQYPRPLDEDLAKLQLLGVDCVFCPANTDIYPPGYSTYVDPPEIAHPFEGASRQTHFRGVATVVLKLFQMIPADFGFFGQKDFQQSLVIKKMVKDFNLPIEIVVCPIVREPDGLAMSSRNAYLSTSDRQRAAYLHKSLVSMEAEIAAGHSIAHATQRAANELENHVDQLEYLAVVDAETLATPGSDSQQWVAIVAAQVGQTRLIDNRLFAIPNK